MLEKELLVISSSGGLDSSTMIYKALNETKFDIALISFNYGQENIIELTARKKIVDDLLKKFPHRIIGDFKLDIDIYKKAFLVNTKETKNASHDFYTPGRNLLFTASAASFGESLAHRFGYTKVYVGMGLHKHSEQAYGQENTQYWDITPKFAQLLQLVFNLNDQIPIEIYAPYINVYKNEIINDCIQYRVPYLDTWTCYDPKLSNTFEEDGKIFELFKPCLKCEACIERQINGEKILPDINNYQVKILKEN